MTNSGPAGCPGARVMTIFVSYVDPHFPNIGYLKYMVVYEGIWTLFKVYEGI